MYYFGTLENLILINEDSNGDRCCFVIFEEKNSSDKLIGK